MLAWVPERRELGAQHKCSMQVNSRCTRCPGGTGARTLISATWVYTCGTQILLLFLEVQKSTAALVSIVQQYTDWYYRDGIGTRCCMHCDQHTHDTPCNAALQCLACLGIYSSMQKAVQATSHLASDPTRTRETAVSDGIQKKLRCRH